MGLSGKIAIVVGAGQTPGETIGNGRATAIRFAEEGARVLLVDKRPDSAEDTAQMITKVDGEASVFGADITVEADCQAIIETCVDRYGRVDILHNNVGIAAGDADTADVTEANWELLMDINLKGMFLTIKACPSRDAIPRVRSHYQYLLNSVALHTTDHARVQNQQGGDQCDDTKPCH